jgi:hypothetical protein
MTNAILRRSSDRKVTNLTHETKNGTFSAKGANSFGLPSGKAFSCPGQTSFCGKICYAGKLERLYKGVSAILLNNWEALQGKGIAEMTGLLAVMIAEFNEETKAQIAKGLNASYDFRIHWDGDFFSRDYAQAWANVANAFPHIRFWVYTRSFYAPVNVIDIIADIPNMNVYLSADVDNIAVANEIANAYPTVRIATVADTFAEAKETITDSTRKTYPCPENAKRIPLIGAKGSACIACGICPSARGDVLFSVKKK